MGKESAYDVGEGGKKVDELRLRGFINTGRQKDTKENELESEGLIK